MYIYIHIILDVFHLCPPGIFPKHFVPNGQGQCFGPSIQRPPGQCEALQLETREDGEEFGDQKSHGFFHVFSVSLKFGCEES